MYTTSGNTVPYSQKYGLPFGTLIVPFVGYPKLLSGQWLLDSVVCSPEFWALLSHLFVMQAPVLR